MTKNGEKNPFSSLKETDNELIDYSNLITDDFDLISYLDQENSKFKLFVGSFF